MVDPRNFLPAIGNLSTPPLSAHVGFFFFPRKTHDSSIVCTRSFIGPSLEKGNSRTSSRQVIALSSNCNQHSRLGRNSWKKEILFFVTLIWPILVKLFVFRYVSSECESSFSNSFRKERDNFVRRRKMFLIILIEAMIIVIGTVIDIG